MENQIEVWKDVVGYEGIYKVSSLGNVKRCNCFDLGVNLKYRNSTYYLKPIDNGRGYLRIKLSKNNKSKRVMLHRIIAEAFVLNIENNKVINHINGIKTDNRISNLEWCTQSQNVKHAYKTKLKVVTKKQILSSTLTLLYNHLKKRESLFLDTTDIKEKIEFYKQKIKLFDCSL